MKKTGVNPGELLDFHGPHVLQLQVSWDRILEGLCTAEGLYFENKLMLFQKL